MRMETIEQLKKIAGDAQDKLWAIQADQFRKANGSKVGKTFRTRNNFSCPKKRSDYWWQYAKVTRMDEGGMLYATIFQTDQFGNVTVSYDSCVHHAQYYTPCPATDFNKAWRALLKKLNRTFQ